MSYNPRPEHQTSRGRRRARRAARRTAREDAKHRAALVSLDRLAGPDRWAAPVGLFTPTRVIR